MSETSLSWAFSQITILLFDSVFSGGREIEPNSAPVAVIHVIS